MAKDLMAPSHAVDAASNEWFDLSVDGRVRGATGGPSARARSCSRSPRAGRRSARNEGRHKAQHLHHFRDHLYRIFLDVFERDRRECRVGRPQGDLRVSP